MIVEIGKIVLDKVLEYLIKKADNQPDVKQWLIDQSTTINGDVNITNNIKTSTPKQKDATELLELERGIMARPKFMFTPTDSDPNYYFRDEYNEVLDTYDTVHGSLWQKDEITKWAVENGYKVDHDFTIEKQTFFPMQNPGTV